MADKEATVFIVDVGQSMGEKHNGREQSDLDWSLQYVWERITAIVATNRKTANVGVLGLRTKGTQNSMSDDENYHHIYEFQELQQTLMPQIRALSDLVQPSNNEKGDAVSAVVIAIEMIRAFCKHLKYKRRIVLVTNARGYIDADDIDVIAKQLVSEDIELTVAGVDFDIGTFKEEGKEPEKMLSEKVLKQLVKASNGALISMADAIADLGIPTIKTTRPVTVYKGPLTLGDPTAYDTALTFEVERYPRVMVANPPSASRYVPSADFAGAGASHQSSATVQFEHGGELGALGNDAMAAIKNARTFKVDDPDAPGGKRDVEREELEKGYEYGRTAVHISEGDMNVVNLDTKKGMSICGFVSKEKFERYFEISKTNLIIHSRGKEDQAMAFSSFIHGLAESDNYAVARYVRVDDKGPVLLLLAPFIEPDFECLIDVELPFHEDVRQFKFPPLDRVVTVSGKSLYQHRNLPKDDLTKAMSDYVDAMDLSDFRGEGEYAPMNQTYSPVLHRLNQAIRYRAINPVDPLPEPFEILTKFSKPPSELVQESEKALKAVMKAAEVKKVPPKQLGRKRGREVEKPLSGLDIDALLGSPSKRVKISSENAIPEFKRLIETTDSMDAIKDGVAQMGAIIEGYIRDSVGDRNYARATEAIGVMRTELLELEEPEMYNDFVRQLKKDLLAQKLGGPRREMWVAVKQKRMGLIDNKASEVSDVTEQDAREFLQG